MVLFQRIPVCVTAAIKNTSSRMMSRLHNEAHVGKNAFDLWNVLPTSDVGVLYFK